MKKKETMLQLICCQGMISLLILIHIHIISMYFWVTCASSTQTMGRVPAGESRVLRITFRTWENLKNWHIGWSTSTFGSARYSTLHTRSFGRLAMEASKCFGETCGKLAVPFFSWRISNLPDFQPWQGCQDAHIPKPTELQSCGGVRQWWLWNLLKEA